jgi:hypothetical protein
MAAAKETVHLKEAPVGSHCEIHGWPTAGLAERLVQAMRARHLTGGINVCPPCIERARGDAHAKKKRRR